MIGLDTNVVIRYLVQDEPRQAVVAASMIDGLREDEPAFLSLVTIVEIHRVLRSTYQLDADRCVDLLGGLLDAREFRIGQAEIVRRAVVLARQGVDFADAVIAELGRAAGCERTVTFDRRAAARGAMDLLR